MNVDLVRSLDPKSLESAPVGRPESGGTSFPDLMDSLLGGRGEENPPVRPERGDAAPRAEAKPSDRSDRGERRDRTERSERTPRSRGAHREERTERSARDARGESAEDRRAEADPRDEARNGRADEAPRAAERPGRGPSRRAGAAGREEEAEVAATPADPSAAPIEAVAAAATPEWLALLAGAVGAGELEAPTEAGASEGEAVAAVAGDLVDGLADGAAVGGAAVGGGELESPEPAVVRPASALEGRVARTVTAALEGLVAGEETKATTTASEADAASAAATPEPVGVAARAAERAFEPSLPRSAPTSAEDPRRAGEANATREADTVLRAEATVAPVAGGEANLSQDRSGNPALPQAPIVEAARGESPAPVPAAAAEAASVPSPSVELAGRSTELAAQTRAEGMPFAQAMRAPEPLSPMQTGRPMPASAPESIAVQADWLATRGGGTARIVLHPPELGEIAIRVTVRNQAVDVVMVAHTALAHQVAEDQSDRLAQAFASRDLRLDQFEVRRGDPSDAGSTGQFGSSDAGARERERAQEEAQVGRGGAGSTGRGRGAPGIEAVVAPTRGVANGRATGIDLRI